MIASSSGPQQMKSDGGCREICRQIRETKMLSYKRRPKRAWSGGLRRGAGCEGLSLLSLAARGDTHVGERRDMELIQQCTGPEVQSAMSEARLEIRRRLRIP